MIALRVICVLVIVQSNLVLPMKILPNSSDKLVKKKDGLSYRLFKRQTECDNGEYPGEKYCCKVCKKGTYVESDCIEPHGQPKCNICKDGVDYMDEDSGSPECHKCQACESASGREVLHKCTVIQDTVCKCKEGFFCSDGLSPNGNCNRCRHCTECDHGVVEACTATKDTVCRSFSVHAIVWPVLLLVLLALFIIGGVIYYKKCMKKVPTATPTPTGEKVDVAVPLMGNENGDAAGYPKGHKPICPPELESMDLENYLYDFSGIMAEVSVLKLALRTITPVDRDIINKDHAGDTREQKYQLLRKWYNENGRQGAFKALLENATKAENEKIMERVLTKQP